MEPTDEQCDWPSDVEDEDSALADAANEQLNMEDSEGRLRVFLFCLNRM